MTDPTPLDDLAARLAAGATPTAQPDAVAGSVQEQPEGKPAEPAPAKPTSRQKR